MLIPAFLLSLSAQRMKDFLVAVTMEEPPPGSVYDIDHFPDYRRCGQFLGQPLAGFPTQIDCAPESIGQYVYVYVPHTEYLHFCEVEVYGLRKYPRN